MNAKLVIVQGEGQGQEISLKLPTVLGRSRDVGITVAHSLISRQHCEIYENDGQLVVRDLGSLNGTFVGETRITESALEPGGYLTVGDMTFQAVYGDFEEVEEVEEVEERGQFDFDGRAGRVEDLDDKVEEVEEVEEAPAATSGTDSIEQTIQVDRSALDAKMAEESEPAGPDDDDLSDFLKSLG